MGIVTNSPYSAHNNPLFIVKLISVISWLLKIDSIGKPCAPPSCNIKPGWEIKAEKLDSYFVIRTFFLYHLLELNLFAKFLFLHYPLNGKTLMEHIRYQCNRTTFKIVLLALWVIIINLSLGKKIGFIRLPQSQNNNVECMCFGGRCKTQLGPIMCPHPDSPVMTVLFYLSCSTYPVLAYQFLC